MLINHEYKVGEIVRLKKGHPCGGDTWKIIRIGADFRIKCLTCDRSVMLPRKKFERQVKEIIETKTE
jgi:hypothetical protein